MQKTDVRSLLLILALASLLDSSCSKQVTKRPEQPGQPLSQAAQWGAETQGVQCRIRPTKRLWHAGEPLTFRVDFRNDGRRVFVLMDDGTIHADRILLDNRPYDRPPLGMTGGRPKRLGPGDRFEDLPLALPRQMELPLGPGFHTIQVVFALEGLDVVSNPVQIEISSR